MRAQIGLILVAAILVTACSGATTTAGSGDATMGDETWRTAALRDVATGEEFRIADLEGKVVAIETMAIWCTTCRQQQVQAQAALDTVDSADVVYVSLDVDPNERAEDLAGYAAREGFGWTFAVSPVEVSRSLAATFGDQVLSPPSTPVIVLGPDGQLVEKHIGIKSADDLVALFEAHLP
jgi:thiol-disulfide isomerase/thioredoxin